MVMSQEFETQLAFASQRLVTQSPFFSPEFNTAIIDGPVRIYFADRFETEALQIYFRLQEVLQEDGIQLSHIPHDDQNVFIMLYSGPEAFPKAMRPSASTTQQWHTRRFGNHDVIGIDIQKLNTEGAGFREDLCQKVKLQFCRNV